MEVIRFYKVNDMHGIFSNFAPFPIFINNKIWPTSEHFFQAGKFTDPVLKEKIRSIKSPFDAAVEGRNTKHPLISDWEQRKEDSMLKALTAKFYQHPDLKAQLLLTGDSPIIEHTVNDRYWGDGGDGTGLNRLGHLLMDVRTKVRKISRWYCLLGWLFQIQSQRICFGGWVWEKTTCTSGLVILVSQIR